MGLLYTWLTRHGDNLLCRMFYLADIAKCLLVHADAQAMQWQTYGSVIRGGSPAEIVPVLDRIIERFELSFPAKCLVWMAVAYQPLMAILWDNYVVRASGCMKALRERFRQPSS